MGKGKKEEDTHNKHLAKIEAKLNNTWEKYPRDDHNAPKGRDKGIGGLKRNWSEKRKTNEGWRVEPFGYM